MLTHLRMTNFALLEEVELDLEKGLSLLTGETGAGKSILIDAICRLLGSRADQDDVRGGESKAVLEAIFELPSPAALSLLAEWEIEPEGSELILRREILSSGRSRMLINNCSVTLQQIRQLAPHLVDLFGQNEHQTLLDPDSQRKLYDKSIGVDRRVRELAAVSSQISSIQKEWRSLREREQQRQRNIDILSYQIREIEEIQPSEMEESELQERKVLLLNREKVHSACETLLQLVLEKDGSFTSQLKEVQRTVLELTRYSDALKDFVNTLETWQEQISDLVHQADTLRRGLDFEEGSLDEIENRLEAYQKLKKKYGPAITDVLNHQSKARQELQADLNSGEREEELLKEVRGLAERYEAMATDISKIRSENGGAFASHVETELQHIALEKCRFRVIVQNQPPESSSEIETDYPAHGRENVWFEIEPNMGEGFRELGKIASGGELSRLMLALKVVGQTAGEERTLIFDEIDAGIGGKVAYQVGERLRRLSKAAQVLCVTHLPQVAAFGDHHFHVQKRTRLDRTTTIVTSLNEKHRIEELARMISGSEVTETALRHARELREQVETTVP